MSYNQNKYNSDYVNLNTYTKGRFGNVNFSPPLSDPIQKDIISYKMNNYNSLSGPKQSEVGYTKFKDSYQPPNCEVCSIYDCK